MRFIFAFTFFLAMQLPFLVRGDQGWLALAQMLRHDEKHMAAVSQLRNYPKLELELKEALNDPTLQRPALEVIIALRKTNLANELISHYRKTQQDLFLETLTILDPAGSNASTSEFYQQLYQDFYRLKSPTAQVILISRVPLFKKLVLLKNGNYFLKSPHLELRIAAARQLAQLSSQVQTNFEWKDWAKAQPYQVRWELTFEMLEDPMTNSKLLLEVKKNCLTEKRIEVQSLCKRLRQ